MAVDRKDDALVCEKEDTRDDAINVQKSALRLNLPEEGVVFLEPVSAAEQKRIYRKVREHRRYKIGSSLITD